MNTLITIIFGIIMFANFVISIWSFRFIRKVSKSDNQDIITSEHIIYTRSSINLIYACIAIITFVLAYLGYNLEGKITKDLKDEISLSAKVDLDLIKVKQKEVLYLDSVSLSKSNEISSINDKARSILKELSGIRGFATLDSDGKLTVKTSMIHANSLVILSPCSGRSNMTINYDSIIDGQSFRIIGSGGSDEGGLKVGWIIL